MEVLIIESPEPEDLDPIEQAVKQYGLLEVNGVLPEQKAFHLKIDGELVGGATGRVHLSKFYLDNLWVKEGHRSKGYGTIIHDSVVGFAQNNSCKMIHLSTLNNRAVEFYLRLNYETLAVIENYVVGFDQHHMAITF